jgi:hypothetical protein
MSTFSHAGVSRLNGKFKVRFCNDALRQKVLIKNGHTDIDIVEMKVPMSKEDAVAYLLSINFDNGNSEVRAALEEAQGKRAPKAADKSPSKKEAKKPKKEPAKKVSLQSIAAKAPKVDLSAMEDAPF